MMHPILGLSYDDVLIVPKFSSIRSRKDVDTHIKLTSKIKLKIPIISANMDTITESSMAIAMAEVGGLGVIHRFLSIKDEAAEVAKVKEKNLLVGAAIGVDKDYLKRARALVDKGVDLLVIDVAHAYTEHVVHITSKIKKKFPNVDLMVGNVATGAGAGELAVAGADIIKVGIGPGSMCTTRIVTGVGVPQITAIYSCAREGISIVADGGIKYSGDITKALGAGAHAVMIGSLFAGTEEVPTSAWTNEGPVYRGMASDAAHYAREKREKISLDKRTAEGVDTRVNKKGSVKDVVKDLEGGLRSGMSYCNAPNIESLRQSVQFMRITPAGLIESKNRDLEM